ncbi:hypothetical protein PHLCEN_2v10709 [Hermanssonia centrifuga]|uniref:Uncharacterized protein n=1 Tax=Hermanssonia centrifuga TaxID=98765 RepID=A0A2R6NLZ7_9APHY|nr:hypothetical protein PHLCEN_2v10709 [Hermanssonia centrifuga]
MPNIKPVQNDDQLAQGYIFQHIPFVTGAYSKVIAGQLEGRMAAAAGLLRCLTAWELAPIPWWR